VRARIAVAAALAAGLALALAGCTFFAPVATAIHYDPSDGVGLNLGDIQLRNVLAISPEGTDANLVGVIINSGTSDETVNFQYTDHANGLATPQTTGVVIPAGAIISFGNPGVQQLVFRDANVKPGAILSVFVQYGDETGKKLRIPVLDGSESIYSQLTPSPTPTPIPTVTATAKPVTK
jgi:hypothetical protein